MKRSGDRTRPSADEFELFYKENFERVTRFAVALSLSRDDAFDLTQEAFARTWAAWDRAQEAEDPIFYTLRIVANLAFSAFRRARRLRELLPTMFAPEVDAPTPRTDNKIVIRDAIRTLPRRERMTVVLAYLADMPAAEIASVMGVSQSTVRVHLSHARSRLAALVGLDPTAGADEERER